MLPSTRIGIQAVSARVWLTMHLSFTPSFPFVSTVEMSLDKAPDVDLRIIPVDDGR
jgi:Ca2+-dependent lipid-binding protein